MDSPNLFAPQSTSTPFLPSSMDQTNFHKLSEYLGDTKGPVTNLQTPDIHDHGGNHVTSNTVRDYVYCQSASNLVYSTVDSVSTKINLTTRKGDFSQRSLSSGNILYDSESGYGNGNQGGYSCNSILCEKEYNSSAGNPPMENKKKLLKRSLSSDGLLTGSSHDANLELSLFCDNSLLIFKMCLNNVIIGQYDSHIVHT